MPQYGIEIFLAHATQKLTLLAISHSIYATNPLYLCDISAVIFCGVSDMYYMYMEIFISHLFSELTIKSGTVQHRDVLRISL